MPASCNGLGICWVVISVLLSAALVQAAPPATAPAEGLRENTPSVHALRGARIVVSPGRVIEKGTLVIRDGVIEAVGAEVVPPPDARLHDFEGRTLYAGFIDAFGETNARTDASAPYWNAQVRPQASAADAYQGDSAVNAKLRGQGIAARLVAPAGGIIKGTSALVTTGDDSGTRAILKGGVAQHLRLTVSRGPNRDQYPNSPMGAVALARQAFYDAQWHRAAWRAYEADSNLPRPERNDALTALTRDVEAARVFVADTSNELYLLRADLFAREFGLRLIVKGSGREYRRLDAVRDTGRAVILPLNFPKSPYVGTPEAAAEASLEQLMHWELAPENAARLEQAGVKILFTSHGLADTARFLAAVRQAVERGLAPEAALRALTSTPAELFGVSDRLGSLEAGKLANVVVSEGDVFAAKGRILETWVDGKRYEAARPPLVDIRGTWQAKLELPGEKQQNIAIKFSGKAAQPAGSLGLADKPKQENAKDASETKLGQLTLRDAQLSFTMPCQPLGIEGTAQLSAVVSLLEGEAATLLGNVTWPDGSRRLFTAKRTAPLEESAEKETETTEKNDDAEGADAAPAEGEKQEPKKSRPAPLPRIPLAVNFPLGEYGVLKQPDQPERVLFTNATIWTAGQQGVLEKASLLIGGGKILAVGKGLAPPAGAEVIDLKGAHLSPGIIDCHSHMATDGGINETGQAITAEVRIGDFINHDDIDIYRQLAGGVTTANVLHGSANPIGGQNQVIKLRWGALFEDLKFAEAPAGIKFALGENVKQSNWGDRFTTRYPQTRMGVEQILRDEFQAAREYQARWAAWRKNHQGIPPRRDLELEAIAEILEGRRWIHCHSYRQDEILATIRVLDDFQVRIGTFQHILEGYKVADAMARHGAMGSAFSDWWAYKFEVLDAIPYAGALMHRAGVVVSFNSDDRELARHLNHEAAKAIKYGGVPPEEAIKFVTANPARQLRIEQYVGALEPGKHADLVVWSGSPLSTLSRCEQTWIDGRKYFDRAEDKTRRDEIRKLRALLVQRALSAADSMRKPGEEDPDAGDLWPDEDIFCRHHGHDD